MLQPPGAGVIDLHPPGAKVLQILIAALEPVLDASEDLGSCHAYTTKHHTSCANQHIALHRFSSASDNCSTNRIRVERDSTRFPKSTGSGHVLMPAFQTKHLVSIFETDFVFNEV